MELFKLPYKTERKVSPNAKYWYKNVYLNVAGRTAFCRFLDL